MENLVMLKNILNSIDDSTLRNMEIYIDCSQGIQMIAVEESAITLITDTHALKINDKEW